MKPTAQRKYDAGELLAALKLRHSSDLFIPECKDGPTQTSSHRRLDAWVLVKTWSPVTTIGYEIKVSRSDWIRDQKIDHYMMLVHRFFVVAPKGIVQPEELPEGAGLIEAIGNDPRLVTRRQAVRHDIELPDNLLIYVLMARVKETQEYTPANERELRMGALRDWTEDRNERERLSYAVNGKIQQKFNEQEARLREIERRMLELDGVRKRICEMGFDPEKPIDGWAVKERLDRLTGVVPVDIRRTVDGTLAALQRMQDALKRLGEASA